MLLRARRLIRPDRRSLINIGFERRGTTRQWPTVTRDSSNLPLSEETSADRRSISSAKFYMTSVSTVNAKIAWVIQREGCITAIIYSERYFPYDTVTQ